MEYIVTTLPNRSRGEYRLAVPSASSPGTTRRDMGERAPEELQEQAFSYYRRLRRVRRYCFQHLGEPISLASAADVAALEPTYFSAYFHDKTGVCFSHWLSHLRVKEAKRLLTTTDRPISLIAQDVGYNNLTSLERAFKRCTGGTPSEYRRGHRPC